MIPYKRGFFFLVLFRGMFFLFEKLPTEIKCHILSFVIQNSIRSISFLKRTSKTFKVLTEEITDHHYIDHAVYNCRYYGGYKEIKRLYRKGVDFNKADTEGRYVLPTAVVEQRYDILELLLSQEKRVTGGLDEAFCMACVDGYIDIIKVLYPRIEMDKRYNYIIREALWGMPDVIKFSSLEFRDYHSPRTDNLLFREALLQGNFEEAERLIKESNHNGFFEKANALKKARKHKKCISCILL